MAFKIGFEVEHPHTEQRENPRGITGRSLAPRKSVVQVAFSDRDFTLAYYNDRFDLCVGDMVYVEGKLEGEIGCVTEVSYNFKIKVSDYKRVICLVDTDVHGKFYYAGTHFVTFDRTALPKEKIITWFKAPEKDEEEFISGSDDTSFNLSDLKGMNVSPSVSNRGYNYYMENRVRYLCIDGDKGYAIVEGSSAYEVEFCYKNGEISGLVCSCFCSQNCKHEVAVMLQLRELLEHINEKYSQEYERSNYFSAVYNCTLFAFAVDKKDFGSITL